MSLTTHGHPSHLTGRTATVKKREGNSTRHPGLAPKESFRAVFIAETCLVQAVLTPFLPRLNMRVFSSILRGSRYKTWKDVLGKSNRKISEYVLVDCAMSKEVLIFFFQYGISD